MKRNTSERRQQIVELVNQQGKASVESLAAQFETSVVTIRKDITHLEQAGLLLRKFGGAVPVQNQSNNAPVNNISKRKLSIAKAALALINDRQRMVIDSGSTTLALLPLLSEKRGLVVMTNALHVADQLVSQENEPTLLMTGGTWDAQSQSFQGQMAEKMLREYNFDLAFVGASGIDLNKGTTTFNELTNLTRVMAEVADKVVVMAESDKLSHKMPNVELTWQQISVLVTDNQLDAAAKALIEQQGVQVICAEPL
ncbi:DeoR/GlpR family DNA-binding transcription regulator [Neptunicella marina]|uniref:DeoR family transcriptional regulator n=1 Tax=Neptunicella marina TaxID=2125989 RepID=A0A8J6IT34_9ALTE|nr:DeoR family transcriptional regulator [Neptunicella marina]MBC3765829.1 DeoR family transcriptional regulator [Neptunicella marina]